MWFNQPLLRKLIGNFIKRKPTRECRYSGPSLLLQKADSLHAIASELTSLANLLDRINRYDIERFYHENHHVDDEKSLSFESQAEDEFEANGEPVSNQENVVFSDDHVGTVCKFNPITDTTFYNDYIPNADLVNFFSRPVEIDSFVWDQTQTSLILKSIQPWFLYFSNSIIKKKLDNFAFVSCNLHVKVVINASPFLYGKLIAAYNPLSGIKPSTIDTSLGAARIPFSQRPHLEILPSKNMAGELVLPFFYNQNWLEVGSAFNFSTMGTLDFITYSFLQSANALSGNSVTVTTYAWAEDVRLCGPTIKLALQAEDEYEEPIGVVSTPASAVATFAGKLENIPIIGRFATATRIGASAISGVAKLFGFTNPPIINDVSPYKSLVFHSLASTQISEPVEKLTLDPKNELTIDPAVSGLSAQDELNITSLITRPSYLTTMKWFSTDVKDDPLFNTTVMPLMNDYVAAGNASKVYSVPMGHIQYLFWNWRGDIEYTFEFIKSPYHRGRVRISWDPIGNIISNADNTSAVFNQIVDISETDKISVRIPYLQALPWLQTQQDQAIHNSHYDWWNTRSDDVNYFEHNSNYTNGTLTLRVLNELTGPVSSAEIDILVHVRACDNFEFANPTDFLPAHSIFAAQAENEDEQSLQVVAGTPSSQDPARYLVNFGERIISLRTLLQRSVLSHSRAQALSVAVPMNICHNAMTRFPPAPGYDFNGFNTANEIIDVGTAPYNFVHNTPFNWLESCYIGRRGSMIWHFNVDAGGNPSASTRVERLITPITLTNMDNVLTQSFTSSTSQEMRFFTTSDNGLPRYGAGIGGVSLTDQRTQGGLSALLPMYNNYRFEISASQFNIKGTSIDGSINETFDVVTTVRRWADIGADNSLLSHKYFSIGPDFQFLFFLNIPTFHVYNTPSAV